MVSFSDLFEFAGPTNSLAGPTDHDHLAVVKDSDSVF